MLLLILFIIKRKSDDGSNNTHADKYMCCCFKCKVKELNNIQKCSLFEKKLCLFETKVMLKLV